MLNSRGAHWLPLSPSPSTEISSGDRASAATVTQPRRSSMPLLRTASCSRSCASSGRPGLVEAYDEVDGLHVAVRSGARARGPQRCGTLRASAWRNQAACSAKPSRSPSSRVGWWRSGTGTRSQRRRARHGSPCHLAWTWSSGRSCSVRHAPKCARHPVGHRYLVPARLHTAIFHRRAAAGSAVIASAWASWRRTPRPTTRWGAPSRSRRACWGTSAFATRCRRQSTSASGACAPSCAQLRQAGLARLAGRGVGAQGRALLAQLQRRAARARPGVGEARPPAPSAPPARPPALPPAAAADPARAASTAPRAMASAAPTKPRCRRGRTAVQTATSRRRHDLARVWRRTHRHP